jgi:hypothetical protein
MAHRPQPSTVTNRAPPPPRPNEGPRVVSADKAPIGRKLIGNIGPGTLRPGAGKDVQRNQSPLRCGTMTGHAFGVTEHANTRDPKRVSLRFAGRVLAIRHDGEILEGAEWYLPPTLGRAIKAALTIRSPESGPVPFSVEIWCEPDEAGRPPSPLGYAYTTYDRTPQSGADPVLALAMEAGIIERPTQAIEGPAPAPTLRPGEAIDPETGEITTEAADSQAA